MPAMQQKQQDIHRTASVLSAPVSGKFALTSFVRKNPSVWAISIVETSNVATPGNDILRPLLVGSLLITYIISFESFKKNLVFLLF